MQQEPSTLSLAPSLIQTPAFYRWRFDGCAESHSEHDEDRIDLSRNGDLWCLFQNRLLVVLADSIEEAMEIHGKNLRFFRIRLRTRGTLLMFDLIFFQAIGTRYPIWTRHTHQSTIF